MAAAGRQQTTRGNCRSLSLAPLNGAEMMSATYAHLTTMEASEEGMLAIAEYVVTTKSN